MLYSGFLIWNLVCSVQGFPNSSKGWGWGIRNFAEGDFFYQVAGTWGEVILAIWTFFKAKNSFLWILSSNFKISMTCVSEEYEIKTNMIHDQRLQLWVITWKLLFSYGEINLWWGDSTGRNFPSWGRGEWANFRLFGWGGLNSPSSPLGRKNPMLQTQYHF